MATYGDLIAAALREIGILAAGETMSADDSADGLLMLNWLLSKWGLEPLTSYTVTRTTKALTVSDGEYTVGSGADINIVRPSRLALRIVNLIDGSVSPNIETPLNKLTDDLYAGITQKSLTSSRPTDWYYNPTYPNGTLTVWPTPTGSSLSIALYVDTALAAAAALATTVSLPDGYELAIVKNLALQLAPGYGRSPSGLLMKQADESLASVKRGNDRPEPMAFDFMVGRRARYDIKRGY